MYIHYFYSKTGQNLTFRLYKYIPSPSVWMSWSGVAVADCVHKVAAGEYPGLFSVQFLLCCEDLMTYHVAHYVSGSRLLAVFTSCTPAVMKILQDREREETVTGLVHKITF